MALQKQYARPGQSVTNAFQTNGLLLDDEWCALFKSESFLVGLSIDGPEALHDRYRVDLHGRGTFARVMAGLERLQKHGVEYNTLTVVQNDNGTTAPRSIASCAASDRASCRSSPSSNTQAVRAGPRTRLRRSRSASAPSGPSRGRFLKRGLGRVVEGRHRPGLCSTST